MANPQSNMYPYKKPNFPDVIGGMKGVKSSEEITHKPLSGIITTTSTTTTQRGFIRVDPDEELYTQLHYSTYIIMSYNNYTTKMYTIMTSLAIQQL